MMLPFYSFNVPCGNSNNKIDVKYNSRRKKKEREKSDRKKLRMSTTEL